MMGCECGVILALDTGPACGSEPGGGSVLVPGVGLDRARWGLVLC
jgi:hypothetical protein